MQDTVAIDSVVSIQKFEEVTDAHKHLITEAQYACAMGPNDSTVTLGQCQSSDMMNGDQQSVTQAQYECDMDAFTVQNQLEAVMDADKQIFTQDQYCGGATDSVAVTQSQFEAVMDVDKQIFTQDQYCGGASVTQD